MHVTITGATPNVEKRLIYQDQLTKLPRYFKICNRILLQCCRQILDNTNLPLIKQKHKIL